MTRVRPGAELVPAWPLWAVLAGFPAWWLIGLVDVAWVVMAAVMALLLVRTEGVRAPRGFGLWLFLLLIIALSVIGVQTVGQALAFGYRSLQYIAAAVIFIYVYNGRRHVTPQMIAAGCTALLLTTMVGGYLGVFFPQGEYRSPMAYLLPAALTSNELVHVMVVRPFAQFDPDSFFQGDPRPSAPYRFTNNWGSMYALLFPFVVARLVQLRGRAHFWWLLLAVPVSLVPAALTLNRGMFLGLGLAAVYTAFRHVLLGKLRVLIGLGVAACVGGVAFWMSPAADRLTNRLETSPTDETRSTLYVHAIEAAMQSPLFGYGRFLDPVTPNAPPVGSHGQFWIVLVMHGMIAAAAFVGFFLVAYTASLPRWEPVAFAGHVVVLVGLTQMFFYGLTPYGLPILMIAAAVAMRPPPTTVRGEPDLTGVAGRQPRRPVPPSRRAGSTPGPSHPPRARVRRRAR